MSTRNYRIKKDTRRKGGGMRLREICRRDSWGKNGKEFGTVLVRYGLCVDEQEYFFSMA